MRYLRCFLLLSLFLAAALAPATAFSSTASHRVDPSSPIRHVVDIFLENHSFDSLLGFWCNSNPGRCPDGGEPPLVQFADGSTTTPTVMPNFVPWIDHKTGAQQAALTNNWDQISGCSAPSYRCVASLDPWQIPNLTTFASYFAISDMTFSQQNSPSWFGHLDAAAATTDGFSGANPDKTSSGWGCDSGHTAMWWSSPTATPLRVPSCIPDPSLPVANGGAFRPSPVPWVPTIMDRLDQAGLSWNIYGAAAHNSDGYGIWDVCPSFADCLYTSQDTHLVPDSQFLTDAASGTLPSFSLVTPGGPEYMSSGHNLQYMSTNDNWVGQLVQSVMSGPDWSSTAIFITYDDCGCFYDQVAPPANLNASGTPAGPRVPLIIVSPYARPSFTDTTPTTFAGILAFTEHLFNLAPLTADDASAYDFSNAFNFAQTPRRGPRIVWRRQSPHILHYNANPPASLLKDPT